MIQEFVYFDDIAVHSGITFHTKVQPTLRVVWYTGTFSFSEYYTLAMNTYYV